MEGTDNMLFSDYYLPECDNVYSDLIEIHRHFGGISICSSTQLATCLLFDPEDGGSSHRSDNLTSSILLFQHLLAEIGKVITLVRMTGFNWLLRKCNRGNIMNTIMNFRVPDLCH
jgi:hypothetical protein